MLTIGVLIVCCHANRTPSDPVTFTPLPYDLRLDSTNCQNEHSYGKLLLYTFRSNESLDSYNGQIYLNMSAKRFKIDDKMSKRMLDIHHLTLTHIIMYNE